MSGVLLILRIVVGLLFVGHGTQKLFGWFGGHGLEATAGFFESMRFRPPRLAAFAAGASEAGGGALFVLGLLTPLAAVMIVGVMVNAILAVHWQHGPWVTEGGYEYPLVMATAAVALVGAGPGMYSFDHFLGYDIWGGAWALATACVGVVAALVVLASRAVRPAPFPKPASPTNSSDAPPSSQTGRAGSGRRRRAGRLVATAPLTTIPRGRR